jgi:CspA family cold shock protein
MPLGPVSVHCAAAGNRQRMPFRPVFRLVCVFLRQPVQCAARGSRQTKRSYDRQKRAGRDNLQKLLMLSVSTSGRVLLHAPESQSLQGKPMTIGTVKFFNTSKGFGFISPEGGGKDVFVHASALEASGMRTLGEGQKVSFDIQPDARGSKAVNLKAV